MQVCKRVTMSSFSGVGWQPMQVETKTAYLKGTSNAIPCGGLRLIRSRRSLSIFHKRAQAHMNAGGVGSLLPFDNPSVWRKRSCERISSTRTVLDAKLCIGALRNPIVLLNELTQS